MAEMRQSLEQERDRLMAEVKKQTELEKQQAVDETKKKQWCANCKKEAIFYCCWNTSYCDYPCQQAHWPEHMKSCTQSAVQQKEVTQGTSTSSITLVTSTPAVSMITTPVTVSTPSTSVNTDFQIATTSADVAADIAKYTSKTNPHPLVWAKLKGFPFWPAKALRDKDGQVDARFFGQHDRAWVPINNCYLMSKEIPFSVKKTKSIFNSAMQEMEIYVDNIGKKFAVFNYAPFRTPYTPNNQFQMLLDPTNPTGGTVRPDKQEKIKFSFDMTASPKIILSKPMLSSGTGRRISLTDMPRSPMSTNSSVHTGSDIEQDPSEKSVKAPFSHYSAGEESMDFTDRSTDRSKAEMDLKELSESVQQQSTALVLTSPKRQIRSRFQLNLDKTIESCKAQLGINEISENAYTGVEHSDSEDSEKSDSSDSEYMSEDEQKLKNGQDEDKSERDLKKKAKLPSQSDVKTEANEESKATEQKTELLTKERSSSDLEKEHSEKLKGSQHSSKEKLKAKEEVGPPPVGQDMDSDSDGELVIDLGEDHAGRDRKKSKKEQTSTNATKETPAAKQEGKVSPPPSTALKPAGEAAASSLPSLKDSAQTSTITIPINVVSIPATSLTSSTAAAAVKKQRPLLPRETAPAVQRAVVWNSTNKFQTSSQKWHMQKKITVAECIETQSKAMTMLTIDQLSYLLKFALQKMKQPGVSDYVYPITGTKICSL
ncbi:Protein kinase C-binding protein 1 [Acipenser ruthenus]|uniref:Protein kinase C-binding protein 1 n=1 Tax=Acipenser ruthenus TaxID=7906 RepID=A0A444UUW3_ACIRT|nr:Protein kinase C-binding protein 1 [Acipenser ruthenus]